jgi:hypothetical protein
MNANPPERAAALERSAGDACAIPKTVDQFRTARSENTRASGVSAAVCSTGATGAKRGSRSLALDAALVHTS